MRFDPHPLLQYFCSECGLLLKESKTYLKHAQLGRGGGKKKNVQSVVHYFYILCNKEELQYTN
jgi:hypothetical protein